MTISVLTIVKNRHDHLTNLLTGLASSRQTPDEVIVVDMSEHPFDPGMNPLNIMVRHMPEQGLPLAKARNEAARLARSDKFLFLDVDCIPGASLVSAINEVLCRESAITCAKVRYLRRGPLTRPWNESTLLALSDLHPLRDFPASGLRLETNPGLFWSLLFGISRANFERLRGFDEDFTGYGAEDTDFGFRAAAAGVPLIFQAEGPAYHQYHETQDPPLNHLEDIVRNANTFMAKHGVWPMEGWLKKFQQMGLIEFAGDRVERTNIPVNHRVPLRYAASRPGLRHSAR